MLPYSPLAQTNKNPPCTNTSKKKLKDINTEKRTLIEVENYNRLHYIFNRK